MPTIQDLFDKAQTALNATPIGQHIPNLSSTQGHSSQSDQHGSADPGATQSARSFAFENMGHQLRTLQQQYGSNTTPLQKIITAQKGVAIDLAGLSRDAKAQSKELYMFGQSEAADLKDVTDRLAYLNFVHGSLALTLSTKLDASRVALKNIRDAENALLPRRNIRAGIVLQIQRIKSEGQKGAGVDRRLAELHDQLQRAENEDQDLEKQFEISKRKFLKEHEEAKWAAIREYGEKLLLLSEASTSFLSVLPSVPPTVENPYPGASTTGATRAALQHALDNWSTGHVNVPSLQHKEGTTGFDTRSFGETHASELSSITSSHSTASIPASGSLDSKPQAPAPVPVQPLEQHPMDPSTLNNTPATIPSQDGTAGKSASSDATSSSPGQSIPTVTVAETGTPITAGATGPGPKTGSLSRVPGSGSAPKYESAEEEKKRLEREERDRVLMGNQPPPSAYHPPPSFTQQKPAYESAEEEKKRLERAERDQVLRMGGSNVSGSNNQGSQGPSGVPPPYQD